MQLYKISNSSGHFFRTTQCIKWVGPLLYRGLLRDGAHGGRSFRSDLAKLLQVVRAGQNLLCAKQTALGRSLLHTSHTTTER